MPNVLLMAWVNVQNTQVLQAYSTHSCVDVSLACCNLLQDVVCAGAPNV